MKIGQVGDTLGASINVLVLVLKVTVCAAATVRVLRAAVPELRLGTELFICATLSGHIVTATTHCF